MGMNTNVARGEEPLPLPSPKRRGATTSAMRGAIAGSTPPPPLPEPGRGDHKR
jgi:hypothetical protein